MAYGWIRRSKGLGCADGGRVHGESYKQLEGPDRVMASSFERMKIEFSGPRESVSSRIIPTWVTFKGWYEV